MNINGQQIIIKGRGVCLECEFLFEGDPMQVHIDLGNHQTTTGHDVYNEYNDILHREIIDSFVDTAMEVF